MQIYRVYSRNNPLLDLAPDTGNDLIRGRFRVEMATEPVNKVPLAVWVKYYCGAGERPRHSLM